MNTLISFLSWIPYWFYYRRLDFVQWVNWHISEIHYAISKIREIHYEGAHLAIIGLAWPAFGIGLFDVDFGIWVWLGLWEISWTFKRFDSPYTRKQWNATFLYHAIYWTTYFFGFLLPNRVKATWAARWFILSQTIDANESIKLSKTLGRINRLRIAIAKRIASFNKIKIFSIVLLSLTDLHLSAFAILAILAVLAIVVGLVVSVTSYRNTSNYNTRRNDRGYKWTDSFDD